MSKLKFPLKGGVGLAMISPIVAMAAGEIEVVPSERFLVTNGRGIATLHFNIVNKSGSSQKLVERLDLPDGWVPLSTLAPFVLGNNGEDSRLIHVSVPKGAGGEVSSVRYWVEGVDDRNINGEESVEVQVAESSGTVLTHSNLPGVLLPGDAYSLDVFIKNTGNTEETYFIQVRDVDGYVQGISPRSVKLKSGERQVIKVSGKVSQGHPVGRRSHKVTLVAKNRKGATELDIGMPVISRIPVGLGKYHKLKGRLSLDGYLVDNTDAAKWRMSYRAHGALDRKGRRHVSVDFRVADDAGSSSVDDYYQVKYRTDDWETMFGNQGFSMNSLTGHTLSGIGASVNYSPRLTSGSRPLKIRAYYGKSEHDASVDEKVKGVEAKYWFNNRKFEVGVSFLSHEDDGVRYDVKSITGLWKSKNASLKGAYADDGHDSARLFDFNTRWRNLNFNYNHRYGGSNYTGSYDDRRENQLGVSWRVAGNNIRATYHETRSNLDNDLSKAISRKRRHTIRGSRYIDKNKKILFSVGYRSSDDTDLRNVSLQSVDRNITAVFLEYKHNFNAFDFSAKWEAGDRDDRIDASGSGSKQDLALRWSGSDKLKLAATYSKNNDLDFSGESESFGLSGSYRLNNRRNFSGYWQKNESESSSADSYGLSYTHRFSRGYELSLNASYIDSSTTDSDDVDNDKRVFLRYSMPLDIPVRRRVDVGSVKGRVAFGKTDKPAKDIVLRLGHHYAVTDKDGAFYYPDVLAKNYALQVDTTRGDVGNYMLNNAGSSIPVEVLASKVKDLKVTLEPAASLNGRLRTFKIDSLAVLNNQNSLTETGGLSGVLIELQPLDEKFDQTQVQKTVTNTEGEFSFIGVPPGRWKTMIVDKIPKEYLVKRRSVVVDLQAEKSTEVLFKVLPRVLTIERTGPVGGFNVSG